MTRLLAQTEDLLSLEVEKFLASKLRATDFSDFVEVAAKQQVIMNLTVGKASKSGQWQYYFGLQQQDLVFYSIADSGAVPLLSGPVAYHWLSRVEIAAQTVRVPLCVCELKLRRSVTTHQLITYSKIAEDVRNVHPHCGYFLIVGGVGGRTFMPETVLRQAKGFNRVFLDWENQRDTVWSNVEAHLTYLRDRAQLIDQHGVA